MKMIAVLFCTFVISSTSFAQISLPQCIDSRGNNVSGSLTQLTQIIRSGAYRPQAYATGVVTSILPDDSQGLPHQKFFMIVGGQITLQIVSNLDFGRIPLLVGQTVSVCGEFLNIGKGMIHWTHFDPRGIHANGFTIFNGQVYGKEEVATTGEINH